MAVEPLPPRHLAVLSDIHGNLPALEAVQAQMTALGVRRVVNLGDIVSGPLWPLETARWLMARGWPTLAGNHERQLLTLPADRLGASDAHAAAALGEAERAWLARLPGTCRLDDGQVFCCHGTPHSDLHYLMETVLPGGAPSTAAPGIRAATEEELRARLGGLVAPLVLCGHSHVQRLARCGDTLLLNPGSVGLPAFDDDHGHPHWVEAGSPHARWALVVHDAAGWQVSLRATAYDHEAAAVQAEHAGRGDWADALRSGRVGRRESRPRA